MDGRMDRTDGRLDIHPYVPKDIGSLGLLLKKVGKRSNHLN